MRRVLLAALAGALAFLSFPPHAHPALVFIALVPLLIAVRRTGMWRAAALGWLSGAVWHLGALGWVLSTIERFEHASTLFALPIFVLFVAWHALQFALFAAGAAWLLNAGPEERAQLTTCCAVASWWVLLEWTFPKVFPWALGNALAGAPLLRQGADLGGVYGLSVLVGVVNACTAAAFSGDATLTRRLRPIGLAAGLLITAALYGAARVHSLTGRNVAGAGGAIRIAVVQGGVPSGRDDLSAANESAWKTYSALSTQDSAPGTDLLVWPETVLRVDLHSDVRYRRQLAALVRELNEPIFFGSLDWNYVSRGELNSGYLIEPAPPGVTPASLSLPLGSDAAERVQTYHKRRLLPFGEYVPGARGLPLLQRWQTTGQFVPGTDAHALALNVPPMGGRVLFAPSICFEAMWPGVFNRMVRDGAAFLVNITDDGWFGDSAGPYEHLQGATMRAVETRRWLVRASNSGVSAFVDQTGRIVQSLPLGAVGVLSQPIGTSEALSLYVRWGDWPLAVCVLVVSAAVVSAWLGAPHPAGSHATAGAERTAA